MGSLPTEWKFRSELEEGNARIWRGRASIKEWGREVGREKEVNSKEEMESEDRGEESVEIEIDREGEIGKRERY